MFYHMEDSSCNFNFNEIHESPWQSPHSTIRSLLLNTRMEYTEHIYGT